MTRPADEESAGRVLSSSLGDTGTFTALTAVSLGAGTEEGIVASAISAVVDSSVTNFTIDP